MSQLSRVDRCYGITHFREKWLIDTIGEVNITGAARTFQLRILISNGTEREETLRISIA